jgi:hypothetical protein
MNAVFPSPLLRAGLTLDAVGSGAMALLQLLLSSTLVTWLQLPQPLLLGTGLFMLGYAALTAWMARAPRLPVALVRLVVFGNFGWAVAVLLLVLAQGVAPNALGLAFLAVHAVSVLGFAALQGPGLARSHPFRAGSISALTETSGGRTMHP